MVFLIAVTGLSGAGKTTAIDHFTNIGLGQRAYLGQYILDEVVARGLTPGSDSEQMVRVDLRKEYGPAVLANRAVPSVKRLLNSGINVFVDAIFEVEEYRSLESCCSDAASILIAIESPFEIRSQRLRSRAQRPIDPEELKRRDDTEMSKLRTDSVIALADYKILNEDTIEIFRNNLERFWAMAIKSTVK